MDPIRIKKQSVFLETKMTVGQKTEIFRFNALVDREKYKSLTPEEQKALFLQELQKVSPAPVSGIYNLGTSFNYVDSKFLEEFNSGNVLVELHIPYCIDIPNGYELEVLLSKDTNQTVLLIPSKIWTQKAQSGTKYSDQTDFFADDKVLYFKSSQIIGPKMPLDPTEGWEPNYTGLNLQKIKNTTGRFRFTHLYMQFDLSVDRKEIDNEKSRKLVVGKVKDIALQAVNNLIDAYRLTTKQENITRLGDINMNMIYFIDLNQGLQLSEVNIETAVMNRSKIEIEKIEKMLEQGEKPNLYELLLLDAEHSINTRNYPLAVVQSFQALEIFIEGFLIKELVKKGRTEKEASDYLSQGYNWTTKTRLKELLQETKGVSLQQKDNVLWNRWCTSYDTIRNEIIHKGKEANVIEVRDSLENNFKVIELLKIL